MNLDIMIAEAYGHFLHACANKRNSQIVFAHYAKDELDLPESEIEGFIRTVEVEDEDEMDSREFDRFYTWYYINYVINPPVICVLFNPISVRVSDN
jgi:hypothetical protein